MWRKALSIRHLLLFAFLLAVLLPAMLITGLAFYEARSALKSAIQNGMQTQTTATALEIDRMMFERLQNVSSWSELDVMQDARIGDIDKRLSSFLTELKDSYSDIYTELYVVNRQDMVIAASNPARLGTFAPRLKPWLHTLIQHKIIKLGQLEGHRLPIYTDINDDFNDDKLLGTIVVVFNWQQIEQILQSGISGRSAAALFAQDKLIAATDRWAKTQNNRRLIANATASGYEGYRGFNWQVSIAQNRSQALTPVRQMAYIFAGLLLVTVLLATVIAIPVARAITRPVTRLTEFATRFLRNPDASLPPAGGPEEIAEMSRAFAKMMEDLDHSKQSLTRAAKLAVAGEMAAAMSHEVRTPLGILRSSAQLLQRDASLTPESQEICGFIIKETERLNKLVNTLVDSAKPRHPELAPSNITELVTMCAGMMRSQAAKKNIEIALQPSASIICECDDEQMTQVMLNLLLNAIQILPPNGKITIHLEESQTQVVIAVSDNGPGVTAEHREQIFDPFFSQRNGGIGLGLAIVRQIILAHHGSIHVEPNDHQGATFVIQLPRNGV